MRAEETRDGERADKARLRQQYLLARRAYSQIRGAEASASICARLTALVADLCAEGALRPHPREGGAIALYRAIRGEADVSGAAPALAAAGWRVAYPVVEGRALRFYRPLAADAWRRGRFGIWEPDPGRAEPVPTEALALVAVPGVAFTPDGRRLGYGGGYYDRWFAAAAGAGPVRVGVCFACQLAEDLPTEAHDVRVHHLVTEAGVTVCG